MKIFKRLALAAAMALTASSAFADNQDVQLTPSGNGMFSAAFSATHSESGLFVDSFTFSLLNAFDSPLGNGLVTFASSSGPISLVVATLEGANGAYVASPEEPDSIAIPSSLSFSNATAPLTLTVLGFAGNPFLDDPVPLATGYSGRITFNSSVVTPVPEPETYALMLAGLAGLGCAARRRKARDAELA